MPFDLAQQAAYRKKRKEEKLKKLEEEAVLAQSMPSALLQEPGTLFSWWPSRSARCPGFAALDSALCIDPAVLSKQLHAFKLSLPSSVKNFDPQHLLECEDAEHDAMHDQLIHINTQLQCPGPILSYVNPEGADAVQLLHMYSR